MDEITLKRLFPNASAAFIAANQTNGVASYPKPKCVVRHEPLGPAPRKTQNTTRFVVSITSFRNRLLDKDNLFGGSKFVTDSIRYSGLIPNDSPEDIDLQITQKKVASKTQERTEIEIIPLQ